MMRKVISQGVSPFFTNKGLRLGTALCAAALLSACELTTTAQEDAGLKAMVEPTLMLSAATAEANLEYEAAASHYRNLLTRNPGDRDLSLRLARVLRYSGQSDQAISLLTPLADESGEGSADILLELGKAHLAADHLNLALRFLRAARDTAPGNWEAYAALGVALDYKLDHADAQQNYLEALGLVPDSPVILNNLGLSQALAGDLSGAIETLRRAADQPTASPQVRQNLALLMALSGDADAAERLARMDLPGEMVRENVSYFRSLGGRVR